MSVSSCEPAPLTNGKTVTETRGFDENITAIHVYHDIDVILVEDDEFRIDVTIGENLVEKITSTVENVFIKVIIFIYVLMGYIDFTNHFGNYTFIRGYKERDVSTCVYF